LLQKLIARQLAHPKGWFGRFYIARWLNKANLAMNEFTLQQLSTSSKDRILEIGFGGGDLLEKILSTKSIEYVAGVDLSIDMVNLVGHRLRHYIQSGKRKCAAVTLKLFLTLTENLRRSAVSIRCTSGEIRLLHSRSAIAF